MKGILIYFDYQKYISYPDKTHIPPNVAKSVRQLYLNGYKNLTGLFSVIIDAPRQAPVYQVC